MPSKHQTANGSLSYLPVDAKQTVSNALWVTNLKQDNQLQGPRYNSRITRHFYPRSYGPGPMVVTGRAESQEDFQDLSFFIRQHHESIMTGGIAPIFIDSNFIGGYRHLLQLVVPGEGIWLQGWIDRFVLVKTGVFEPAPVYNFSFSIAHDPRSKNTETSFAVRNWFSPDPTDLGAGAPVKVHSKNRFKSRNNKTPVPSPNKKPGS